MDNFDMIVASYEGMYLDELKLVGDHELAWEALSVAGLDYEYQLKLQEILAEAGREYLAELATYKAS